jgi:site-specific DNA-methyltransferase (adenine-specific)
LIRDRDLTTHGKLDILDNRGLIFFEKAPLAVMITSPGPDSRPMIKEAAAAGFLGTPFGRFPRVQIVTVEKLLDRKLPKLPPQERGGGYKRAEREETAQEKLL